MRLIKVKNLLSIVFILIVTTMTAFGQIGVSPGITGGLNFSSLSGENVNYSTALTRYAIGVSAEISSPFLPIAFQLEVLYSEKGGKGDGDYTLPAYVISSLGTYKYSYIDVPILLKYYFSVPAIKPYIILGPSVDFLLNAKREITDISSSMEDYQYTEDIKDRTTHIEISGVVGVGIKVPLAIIDLSLEARYGYGFTNLYNDDSYNVHNSVLAVFVGLQF